MHRMRVFIDGGAHAGETFEWVNRSDFGRVILVEPNPVYWETLEPLGKLFRVALSDEDGRAKFYTSLRTDWGNSLLTYKGDEPMDIEHPIEVQTVDAALWLEKNTQPEDRIVLKLDIEGSEYSVLFRLLEHPVASRIERLLVEWHPIPGLINYKEGLIARMNELGIAYEEWPH